MTVWYGGTVADLAVAKVGGVDLGGVYFAGGQVIPNATTTGYLDAALSIPATDLVNEAGDATGSTITARPSGFVRFGRPNGTTGPVYVSDGGGKSIRLDPDPSATYAPSFGQFRPAAATTGADVAGKAAALGATPFVRAGTFDASTMPSGLPARTLGPASSVVLPDAAVTTATPGTQGDDTGLIFKRPSIAIAGPIHDVAGQSSTVVQTGVGVAVGTHYRPFSEVGRLADGSLKVFGGGGPEKTWYMSGGYATASDAPQQWRLAYSGRAIITGTLTPGQTVIPVDNVDGIDRAFFTAAGAPVPRCPLKPGGRAWVQVDQAATDAHETPRAYATHVVAVTPDNPATITPATPNGTGPGTVRLAEPPLDGITRPIGPADMHWSWPTTDPQYVAKPDGPLNTTNFSITAIDDTVDAFSPNVSGLVIDASDGSTSTVLIGGGWTGAVENCIVSNAQSSAFSFQHRSGGVLRDSWLYGGPAKQTSRWMEAVSCAVRVEGGGAIGFGGEPVQVETGGELQMLRPTFRNTHPTRNNSLALVITNNGSRAFIEDAVIRGTPCPLSRVGSGLVQWGGTLDLAVTGPANLRPSHLARACRPRIRAFTPDGVLPYDWSGDPARQVVLAIQLKPSMSATTIVKRLPPGLIRSMNSRIVSETGGTVTSTGLLDVAIRTTPLAGSSPTSINPQSCLGLKMLNPEGAASDTRVYTTTTTNAGRDTGSAWVWPDAVFSALITGVGRETTGALRYWVDLDTPLPSTLSTATAPAGVRFNGFIDPAGSELVTPEAFTRLGALPVNAGVMGGSMWNAWKIAGADVGIAVTTDATATGSEWLMLEVEFFPPTERPNGLAEPVGSDTAKTLLVSDRVPAGFTGLTEGGKWTANTWVAAGEVRTRSGLRWARRFSGSTGTSFTPTNWVLLSDPGDSCVPAAGKALFPLSMLAMGAGAPATQVLSHQPVLVGADGLTISGLSVSVTTPQVGGTATATVGLYYDDGTGQGIDWAAGPLMSGTVDMFAAASIRTVAAPGSALALSPGKYHVVWLLVTGGTVTTPGQVMCTTTGRPNVLPAPGSWTQVITRAMASTATVTTWPGTTPVTVTQSSSGVCPVVALNM